MSDKVQCPICQDFFRIPTEPTHDFVTFPCRHGTCRTCLQEIYRRAKRPTEADCPVCRQSFNRNAAHHLYLSFERATIASAITTSEKLGEMDAKSKLISVRNAGEHVRKASESLECRDSEVAESLIKAVEDFKERIIPVFEAQEAQMEELVRLRTQLQEAHREASKAKAIAAQNREKDAEIDSLRKQLKDARQSRSQVFAEAASLAVQVKRLQSSNETLVDSERRLEESNTKLKGMLEEHNKTNRSLKVKVKALKEENRSLSAQLEARPSPDIEESLMIDDNRTEILQQTWPQTGLRIPSPSPPSHSTPHKNKENARGTSALSGYEGLPRPGFKSDWSMGADKNPLKRKSSTTAGISVDRKGQLVGSVQLGPKRSRRAA